jgi:hypothetical protein
VIPSKEREQRPFFVSGSAAHISIYWGGGVLPCWWGQGIRHLGGWMMELEIVYLDPHELTPYENNTRKHTPEDIEQIKESIE